jgi:hypothetical protein
MYYTESELLAARHPDLTEAAERIDEALARMDGAEVIRADELARFLGLDLNQTTAVLDGLAEASVLRAEEMVECPEPDCGMPVLRSDYDEALEEDGEYRCTSCDRPWVDEKVRPVITYRRGEKWRGVLIPEAGSRITPYPQASTVSYPILDEKAWYTPDRLAEIYGVGKDALRKRLDRYREKNFNGWKENEDRRPREPEYLYQLQAIKNIIEELRASRERPAK